DHLFTLRLDLGWGCVIVGDEVGGPPRWPSTDSGFLRWGQTLAVLRALADAAVAVDGSGTWELGRHGPPTGALTVRRDSRGTEVRVGDRLSIRLDKKRY